MDIRSLLDWRNAAPGTGVLMSAGWLAEQFATAQMWFSQIPFGWLAIASFAFWLGYDLYHPRGRLREAWRYYNAFVNFGSIYQRQVTYDRGPDHGGSLTHIGLMLPVTFRRTVTIEAVRMTGYAYRFHGVLPIETDAWAVHVWKTEIGGRYLHGDTADLALAHISHMNSAILDTTANSVAADIIYPEERHTWWLLKSSQAVTCRRNNISFSCLTTTAIGMEKPVILAGGS
jgi:hypothetical protein